MTTASRFLRLATIVVVVLLAMRVLAFALSALLSSGGASSGLAH
jgi:hypothetical protein